MSAVPRLPPALDVIPSEEIVQYISPALLTLDYNSTRVKVIFIIGSFLFFTASCLVSLAVCSGFTAFRAMRLKHRVFMSLAISRGIFGLLCIVMGGYGFLMKQSNLERDVVFGKTLTSALSIYVTVGFFIFELAAVVISDICFNMFSKMLLVHHGLSLVGFVVTVYQEANYSFASKGMLLEMSTPFSCMCFILLKAGMENSTLWRINQFVLVHTFHLRSVVECYLWYYTYNNWEYISVHMPLAVFIIMYLQLFLVTFIMTPYWGYKKTQQLFNPVDWNFEDLKNQQQLRQNGLIPNGNVKKMI